MSRNEFSKPVKVEIIKRGSRLLLNGLQQYCEKCGAQCTGRFEIHHINQDAMQIDKSRKLTAADGLLLCLPCHKEETKAQAPILAKAKRIEARHLGATKIKVKIPSKGFAKKERTHAERVALPPRLMFKGDD